MVRLITLAERTDWPSQNDEIDNTSERMDWPRQIMGLITLPVRIGWPFQQDGIDNTSREKRLANSKEMVLITLAEKRLA